MATDVKMPELPVATYLEARHRASCAVYDPVPDHCDCGEQQIPLVRLSHAVAAIQAKDAEIRRIRDVRNDSANEWRTEVRLCRETIAERDAEIAALRAENEGLKLDLHCARASVGHLSRLVDQFEVAAERYAYLRERDLDTIKSGGVFAGRTPHNVVLNGDDLDAAIDAARAGREGV